MEEGQEKTRVNCKYLNMKNRKMQNDFSISDTIKRKKNNENKQSSENNTTKGDPVKNDK